MVQSFGKVGVFHLKHFNYSYETPDIKRHFHIMSSGECVDHRGVLTVLDVGTTAVCNHEANYSQPYFFYSDGALKFYSGK